MEATWSMNKPIPRCSDAEYARRHRLVKRFMQERDLAALVIYGGYREMYQQNVRWYSNYADVFHCYVVVPGEGEATLFNAVYPHLLPAKAHSVLRDTRWGGPAIARSVVERLRECTRPGDRVGIVGLDSNRTVSIPASHYLVITEELRDRRFIEVTVEFEDLRRVKSPEEIEMVRKGAYITERCMDRLLEVAKPGVSERLVYAEVMAEAYRQGGEPNFLLLASTPMDHPQVPYPHPWPSDRILQERDLILNELCANYGGYSGQLIRPISIGKPTPDYQDLYKLAVELYYSIQAAIKPGATTEDVLAAIKPIVARGNFYIQAPVVHGWDNKPERPWIGLPGAERHFPVTPYVFREGELVMIEPNPCTLDLTKGVFFGTLNVVTASGCESVHHYSDDFLVIG